MRYIPMEQVESGMVLAKAIYDEADRVLIGAYIELTQDYISKLTEIGYEGVYIEDELSGNIEIQEAIARQLRNNAVESLKECNIDKAVEIAEAIVEQLIGSTIISLDLVGLRSFDEYTYRHSVNVAVFSTVVGMGIGLSSSELIDLCAAAILHDIGKLLVGDEILNKPTRLTDEEFAIMKQHTTMAYELLKGKWSISAKTKKGVLLHHENEDGSGYPYGLKGEDIHLYAKIIHVADVYDALTTKRPYKNPYSRAEAMEYLMGGCGVLFDKEIVSCFIERVPIYPKDTKIVLSTGESGIVVKNHRRNNLRPIVRLENGKEMDLSDTTNLSITIVGIHGQEITSGDKLIQMERERDRNKKQILIVDDMVSNLKMLQGILQDKYRVCVMKSGEQTLKFLQKNQPDLILMDIDRSEMDENVTIETIQNSGIPVVLVTSLSDKEAVNWCCQIEAKDYIVKPYKPTYVLKRIEMVFQ